MQTATEFESKTAGQPAAQAIFWKGQPVEIEGTTWAGIDKGGSAALFDGNLVFEEAKSAFPINRGAGLIAQPGHWVVRFYTCQVAILTDAEFRAAYIVPAEG